MDFDSGAPSPSRPRRANSKSPSARPCRYSCTTSSAASFVRRANSGSTRLSNRSSTSRTRGRHTSTVPEAKVRFRGFPYPLRYPFGPPSTDALRCDSRPAAQKLRDLVFQDLLDELLHPPPHHLLQRLPHITGLPPASLRSFLHETAFLSRGLLPGSCE